MNVFRRAIQLWGKRAQLDQLQEECGEVVTAINHYRRGRITDEDLASEIVDLKIMIQQMYEIFDHSILDKAYDKKIARLDVVLSKQESAGA